MDEQRNAEELDGEVLGEEPGDDVVPGQEGYPPERPLGVEDPVALRGGADARDDLTAREWRHRDDPAEDALRGEESQPPGTADDQRP